MSNRRRAAALALIALAGMAAPASAQVSGICVDNCASAPPPQPAPEPPRAGAAASVSGDVTFVYPDGRRVSASPGMAVPLGVEVVTGSDGRLQILLLDDTVFTLGPNSDMVIDEFVYDPNESIDHFFATLVKGLFRFVTGRIAHDPSQWRVQTPAGDGGIRGTTFSVQLDPDGSGAFSVEEGEVVFDEYDSDKQWDITAGQTLKFENFAVSGLD